MRVIIDVPPEVMRAAKDRAAERGESLKQLLNRAIVREAGLSDTQVRKAGRVQVPLIARGATPTVQVTNEDIADVFDAEDVERYTSP